MSQWMNRKDLCQRCFSGIDDDQDGNCPTCANMDDEKAAWMKKTRLIMEMETSAFADSLMSLTGRNNG